jgi:excisionase family DNA binding protein
MSVDETAPALPLLDVGQAREALGGISRGLLHRLVAEGELKAVKVSRRTMFRASDLQAYVDANVRGPERAEGGEPIADAEKCP